MPMGVTFLCPHKKVTKESGTGEALRSALPRGHTPSPVYPTRGAPGLDTARFRSSFCRLPNIFPAMRRGVYRGAHLHVAPPISASFGTFTTRQEPPSGRLLACIAPAGAYLAETRKERYSSSEIINPRQGNLPGMMLM